MSEQTTTTTTTDFAETKVSRAIKAKIAGESKRVSYDLTISQPVAPESLSFATDDDGKIADPIAAAVWAGFIEFYQSGLKLNVVGLDKDKDYPTEKAVKDSVQVSIANGYDWTTWEAYLAALAESSGRITPAQRAAALRAWLDSELEACAAQVEAGQSISKVYLATLGALQLAARGNGPQASSAWYGWLSAPIGLKADGSMKSPKQVENLSAALLAPESRIVSTLVGAWMEADPTLLGRFATDLSDALAQHRTPVAEDDADF